jgi:ABC-type transporter Mla subunit MlaD
MAQKERSQFKAGLFIIISLLLIFGVVIAIKGFRTVFIPVEQRKVRFSLSDDVGGLRLGDEVRIGGFKVGVVKSIDLQGVADNQQPSLLVTFTIPTAYQLRSDSHVAIQSGLTGTSVLNFDDLGTGATLAADQELQGHPSSFSTLMALASKAGPDLQQLISTVKTETLPRINDDAAKVGDTLTAFHATADHGTTMADTVTGYLSDTKSDFRTTVANLNSITSAGKAKIPGILDHVDTVLVKAAGTIDNAKQAVEDAKATLANARDITANARNLMSNNRGKFDNIIASFKATADNLKGATAEIRRSPWRILYHPGPGEMDNLELYDAARQFADGANNVNDAALALRDAMQNPNVDHDQVQKLLTKLDTSFNNFNTVEQKLWKAVKPE